MRTLVPVLCAILVASLFSLSANARPPIRSAFFTEYPNAVGTQLDNLPSNAKHCGVCHFDFDGGGPRNPYGLAIEVRINNGMTNTQAIQDIANLDSDGDGYANATEVTNLLFTNTPTFPGLTAGNLGSTSHVTTSQVSPYLTPMGSTDTTPPAVAVTYPNGNESIPAGGFINVTYTATDANGVASVDVYFSDDGGATFEPVGLGRSPTGSFAWFVPDLPSVQSRIRVTAHDNAGNPGSDLSDADFTVTAVPPGVVPSTLRDLHLTGTQPLSGVVLDDVEAVCATCHADYNAAVEPGHNWRGSMMAQAARDPIFFAAVAVAEQDAPSAGDLCLRCHTPGGWAEGRSVDTSGGMLTTKDRQSVQCDFCHRLVDPDYKPGVSPTQDVAVLAALDEVPLTTANGQFVIDPAPLRRGPFADADASHDWAASPFHRGDLCGTCHDVSNPVFVQPAPGKYAPNTFDQEHPDMDLRNMFPVERTFSEWSVSEYATTGVYAPQFAGNKPDGMVSTCQDCHMHDVNGRGCNISGAPMRADLPLHDMTGGNTFVPGILDQFYPSEIDAGALADGVARATTMLHNAATLQLTPQDFGVTVRVTNETGHKLPSGYPEGRRIWLNVRAVDHTGATVFQSGVYDPATAELAADAQLKVYEIHPGVSPGLAGALGVAAGPSFHFVLNDTVFFDNRIPPRGFTNTAFQAVQSPPVEYTYADGEYWDDTNYNLPAAAETVHVTLYYQTISKEYVTFLRDANGTNSMGDDLYDAWASGGKSAPVAMVTAATPVNVSVTGLPGDDRPRYVFGLEGVSPNPLTAASRIAYSLDEVRPVRLAVHDARGRLVALLVDELQKPGPHEFLWNGHDENGRPVAAGLYFVDLRAGTRRDSGRIVVLR